MAMDATGALVGAVDRNTRAKGLAPIIASRALRFGDDVLRAIIYRVRIVGMRNRDCLVRAVRPATQVFVVRSCGSAAVTSGKIGVTVVIGVGSEALPFAADKVQAEDTARRLRRRIRDT